MKLKLNIWMRLLDVMLRVFAQSFTHNHAEVLNRQNGVNFWYLIKKPPSIKQSSAKNAKRRKTHKLAECIFVNIGDCL
jgi:hypothetical protein